jgi:Tfp pilus assembly protein FimV
MSNNDTFDQVRPRRARPARAGSSRALSAVLLVFACGIVAVVLRQSFGGIPNLYEDAPMQSSALMQPSGAVRQASDAMMPPGDELRQSMRDLQASLQQIADKLEVTQRQLASEQGERKLLAEQVGALSLRVNGVSASNASVATTGAPIPKRKPVAAVSELTTGRSRNGGVPPSGLVGVGPANAAVARPIRAPTQ